MLSGILSPGMAYIVVPSAATARSRMSIPAGPRMLPVVSGIDSADHEAVPADTGVTRNRQINSMNMPRPEISDILYFVNMAFYYYNRTHAL